jgi:hypothetical protein
MSISDTIIGSLLIIGFIASVYCWTWTVIYTKRYFKKTIETWTTEEIAGYVNEVNKESFERMKKQCDIDNKLNDRRWRMRNERF